MLDLQSRLVVIGNRFGLDRLRNDLSAGLTSALLTLPLALAFGQAAGLGAIAGLSGVILGGLLSSSLGADRGISYRPTAELAVAVGAIVGNCSGNMAEAFTVVMLAGALQFALGAFQRGRYIAYSPASVVSGFSVGCAALLMITQLFSLLGHPALDHAIPGVIVALTDPGKWALNWYELGLAAAALLMLVAWPKRISTRLPAPFGVLVIGTTLAMALATNIPTISADAGSAYSITIPSVRPGDLIYVVQTALLLGWFGSSATTKALSAVKSAVDFGPAVEKEFVAQGISTLAVGALGALPGVGTETREAIGGGKSGHSPISALLGAAALSGVLFGGRAIVGHIPVALLSAILIKLAWDLFDWRVLLGTRHARPEETVPMLSTAGTTVLVDPFWGIALGLVLAILMNLRLLVERARAAHRRTLDTIAQGALTPQEDRLLAASRADVTLMTLDSPLAYAAAFRLADHDRRSGSRPRVVIYDLSLSMMLDDNTARTICELIDLTQLSGQRVFLSNIEVDVLGSLEKAGVFDRISRAQCFEFRRQAIMAAASYSRTRRRLGP